MSAASLRPRRRMAYFVKSAAQGEGYVFARTQRTAERIARRCEGCADAKVSRFEEWDHYLGLYMHVRLRNLREHRQAKP